MVRPSLHRHAYEDYVRLDEYSNVKLEFLDGAIYAMAGGTPEHAALAFAIGRIIGGQLGESCRGFTSDLKVHVLETDLATYPDLTIVCGEMMRDPADRLAVTNPIVLVEVLSDSTELHDRNVKRDHYQRIPSLQEYVLVSHRERLIEVFRRTGDAWIHETAGPGETLALTSIAARVPVDEIYQGVL